MLSFGVDLCSSLFNGRFCFSLIRVTRRSGTIVSPRAYVGA